jgi:acyl-CoA thioesterase-2
MQSFNDVLDLIMPEQVGDYWFTGRSPTPQLRIFGGQVLGQCLLAANATVDDSLVAHSMHAYFLRAGDSESRIEFEVDPIRNGRSFCTRRVVARQHGEAIFNTAVSYHKQEPGVSHTMEPPSAVPPEDCKPVTNPQAQIGIKSPQPNLMDLYGVERLRVPVPKERRHAPYQQSWMRVNGDPGNDPKLNQVALAMISDFALLSTAFRPHDVEQPDRAFMAASLDHSIWFHNPVKMDDFILYNCDSPWSGGARGFSRGSLWSRDGVLLASTCQESLMRPVKRD